MLLGLGMLEFMKQGHIQFRMRARIETARGRLEGSMLIKSKKTKALGRPHEGLVKTLPRPHEDTTKT